LINLHKGFKDFRGEEKGLMLDTGCSIAVKRLKNLPCPPFAKGGD
jgi:hypothetical protein